MFCPAPVSPRLRRSKHQHNEGARATRKCEIATGCAHLVSTPHGDLPACTSTLGSGFRMRSVRSMSMQGASAAQGPGRDRKSATAQAPKGRAAKVLAGVAAVAVSLATVILAVKEVRDAVSELLGQSTNSSPAQAAPSPTAAPVTAPTSTADPAASPTFGTATTTPPVRPTTSSVAPPPRCTGNRVSITVPQRVSASFTGSFRVLCPPPSARQYWLLTRFQNVGTNNTTNYYAADPADGQAIPSDPGVYEIPLHISQWRDDRCYGVVSVTSALPPGAQYVNKLPDGAALASAFACTDVQ
jgi:hypothetical protein